MEPTPILQLVGQFGLSGIVFAIWYFDDRKIEGYKEMVQQLLEVVRAGREERAQFVSILEKRATLDERLVGTLNRVEQVMTRK